MAGNQMPLAARMRPKSLDGIAGQKHVLGPDKLLYRAVKADKLESMILYGPPGCGKTTIAMAIANETSNAFVQINATTSGKKDMEKAVTDARKLMRTDGLKTVLFIDEIHRFNKAQQDFLLPFVEQGVVTLVGATTENPFFEVNPALVSRSVLFELTPVGQADIEALLDRAMADAERGLGNSGKTLLPDARAMLAEQANGDVRTALSMLETACLQSGTSEITVDDVDAVIQRPHLRYDKDGDMHYDTVSAFIKSMRGSDPDAVLYYLARMITAGEDPKFIARRIMIHAAEDVGCADPMALCVAAAAAQAVERIGFPEGRIILAEAAVYVAMAPKSNSMVMGIDAAMEYVRKHPSDDVPDHLKDAHYKSAKKLGHGIGYLYPHDFPGHWVPQRYLPESITERFYKNSHIGHEQTQADYQNGAHRFFNRSQGGTDPNQPT